MLGSLLRPELVEAVTWAVFRQLMRSVVAWFEPGSKPVAPAAAAAQGGGAAAPPSPLLLKCNHIQSVLLASADPPLASRLHELNVEPQMYLLRWLRLLFGREFHLEDVKVTLSSPPLLTLPTFLIWHS